MRLFRSLRYRVKALIIARLLLILAISLTLATLSNRDTYKEFYGKKLFSLHTADLKTLADQMTIKLNFFLDQGNDAAVKDVLDASFGLFGFVITDCKSEQRNCPEQRMIYSSDPSLPWLITPTTADLTSGSFAVLRRLPKLVATNKREPASSRMPGEIIGRLYVISNMPHSFSDDYLNWLSTPFDNRGAWRIYLRTALTLLFGGVIISFCTELYLMSRRRQNQILLQRESELRRSVDGYLKQLSEKDSQLTRMSRNSEMQFEEHIKKIRLLEQKVQNDEEYRELAEQIIYEMEVAQHESAINLEVELKKTREEIERLQEKIEQFESSTDTRRESNYKELEAAVRPQFSNQFEQKIFDTVSGAPQFQKGDWRVLINFDVAPGRNYRQFTDLILINQDALIILEAKYYVGVIESPGDFLNDIWISSGSQRKKIESLWGENPYHQLNEYAMSLMKILKQRSRWTFQIFGIIVFPDEADISRIGEHLGKFYRVTTIGRLPALIESIFAEARRFQASKNPVRPTVMQVEDMLRGRKVAP